VFKIMNSDFMVINAHSYYEYFYFYFFMLVNKCDGW
jgi:hypothetical protein